MLRRVFLATRDPKADVLRPNWKGPYEIEAVIRPGVNKLARLKGGLVPRAWNAEHLRIYYQYFILMKFFIFLVVFRLLNFHVMFWQY